MRQLLPRVLEETQVLRVDAEIRVPPHRFVDPVLVPLFVCARLDEEFHLHLLKLTSTEDEVSGCDLVAERLADLPDAEGRLHTRCAHDVRKVGEDPLCGFGSQVVHPLLVVDGAEEGLQHPREVLGLGPRSRLAGVRVTNVRKAIEGWMTVLLLIRFEKVIGAVALMGVQ